jgi:hypothetical protein
MFMVGQKVICVDNSASRFYGTSVALKKGAVYTVTEVLPPKRFPPEDGYGICVAEAQPAPRSGGFLASRFRPAVNRNTDIAIFTAMLSPSIEQIGVG